MFIIGEVLGQLCLKGLFTGRQKSPVENECKFKRENKKQKNQLPTSLCHSFFLSVLFGVSCVF